MGILKGKMEFELELDEIRGDRHWGLRCHLWSDCDSSVELWIV